MPYCQILNAFALVIITTFQVVFYQAYVYIELIRIKAGKLVKILDTQNTEHLKQYNFIACSSAKH